MTGHSGSARAVAHLRFALCAFLMLLLAAVYLGGAFFSFMEERRAQETEARVQLLADLLATRIANAVRLGIPLDRLEGVTPLLSNIREANREILSIDLMDATQRTLWRSGEAPAGNESAAARQNAGTLQVTAPVRVQGKDLASIVIRRQTESLRELLLETTLLVILAVLASTVAAAEAARYALGSGSRMRDELVAIASQRAADGSFATLFVTGSRRRYDLRPLWITTAMRRVNEQHVRVRRLIESLRQTEPNARRRRSLDLLLDQASGADTFAASTPVLARLYPIEAWMRWLLLLAACSAESLRVLWRPDQIGLAGWGVALAACGAGFGFQMAARFRGHFFVLVLVALSVAALVLLANIYVSAPGWLLVLRGVMGVTLGTLLAAAAWVEKRVFERDDGADPSRAGSAAPACTTVVLAGWLIGAEWLGPVMGSLAMRAFGPQYGAFLLMVPLLAALISALRWAAIHGTWRIRQDKGWPASDESRLFVFTRQILPHSPHQLASLVLGAMIAMLTMLEPRQVGTIEVQWLIMLWTASGLGVVAALHALKRLQVPTRLVQAVAFAAPCMLALSALPGIGAQWAALVPVAAVALASAAWWTLYLGDARLPRGTSFFLLAGGAALQSLLHLALPVDQVMIAWGVLAALAAVIVALQQRPGS